MIVLGLETSCDETAAAIVSDVPGRRAGGGPGGRIHANLVLSQLDQHRPYQGVVPEIAARAHIEHLDRLIEAAMREAGVGFAALDAIAATAGPGLIGGVMVALLTAKAIALAAGKPLIAVNHLEGHALTVRLGADVPFPYLLLLVSGGHCQLLIVSGVGSYHRLGTTIDDAVGEAFDKTAKLLSLGYPGGPAVERAAATGDPARFALPRPMLGRAGCDFSFSGLKTAVRQALAGLPAANEADRADLAAAFQAAVADVLADRTVHAMAEFQRRFGRAGVLVVAGGVAANRALRLRLQGVAESAGFSLLAPPPELCTDNGAMIAWAGLERFRTGLIDDLAAAPRARWPLDPRAAPAGTAVGKA